MKSFSSALLSTIIMLLVFAAGFWSGVIYIKDPFRDYLNYHKRAQTLGGFLKGEGIEKVSKKYPDLKDAKKTLENTLWSVKNVPAPFVGTAPMQGEHFGARISADLLRGVSNKLSQKKEGNFRVFLIGGSAAFGAGASSDEQTIVGNLNSIVANEFGQQASRFEIYTLANPAWVSTHERIVIENLIADFQPDLVISLSGFNDMYWARLGRNIFWFRTFVDELFFSLIKQSFELADFSPVTDPVVNLSSPLDCSLVASRLSRNVSLASYALSMVGAKYVFLLQPKNLEEGVMDEEARNYFRNCYPVVRDKLGSVAASNYSFLELDIAKYPEISKWFIDSVHLSNKGNQEIAKIVFDEVLQSEFKTYLVAN